MTSVDEFALVLVREMETDKSTALVDGLLKQARGKLKSSNGSIGTLTQAGANGKTFTRQTELTPAQLVNACRQALDIFNGDDDRVSTTYGDFSNINR